MTLQKRVQEQLNRLKKMGWAFLIIAITASAAAYFLPDNPSNYWLSANGKKGFYVLSTFFAFLGFYCWGAVWRKRTFI